MAYCCVVIIVFCGCCVVRMITRCIVGIVCPVPYLVIELGKNQIQFEFGFFSGYGLEIGFGTG